MILGFSTGCLYRTKKYHRVSKEIVEEYINLGCNAIELNCLSSENFQAILDNISKNDLARFEYVSVHAPSFGKLTDEETRNALDLAQKVYKKLNFNHLVIHPDEVKDWSIFEKHSFPISIENMDSRKNAGKTIESMDEIFSKYDVPMTLDLNHCFTNDSSMKLASDMAEKFKDRIGEIHLSGCDEYKQPSYHDPIYQTKQQEILDAIPNGDIPIIIESACNDMTDVRQEYAYVKQYLKDRK